MALRSSRTVACAGRVVANLLAVGMLVLALQSWPAREWIRAAAAAQLTRALGAPVSIGALRYDLTTLRIEADDIAVSSEPAPATTLVFIRQVVADLSWRALLAGRAELELLQVSKLDVVGSTPDANARVAMHGIWLSMARDSETGMAGHVELRGPGSVVVAKTTRAIVHAGGALRFDGNTLHVTELRAAAPHLAVVVRGRIENPFGETPRYALNGAWRASAPDLCAAGSPRLADSEHGIHPGEPAPDFCDRVRDVTLHGALAIDGVASSPELRIDIDGEGVVADTASRISIDGEATMSTTAIAISRLEATAFGGQALFTATVPLNTDAPESSASVRWNDIDLRAALAQFGIDTPIGGTCSGNATVGGDLQDLASIDVDATARLIHAGAPAGNASLHMRRGDWELRLVAGRIGVTSLDVVAAGRVAGVAIDQWATLPIGGSLKLATSDIRDTAQTLNDMGLTSAVTSLAGWSGSGAANLRLAGTIGAVRLAGTVDGSIWHAGALEPIAVRADVQLARDVIQVQTLHAQRGDDRIEGSLRYRPGSRAIEGELSAALSDLTTLAGTLLPPDWTVRGSATASTRISGTAARPQVHAVVRGADLAIQRPALSDMIGAGTTTLGVVEIEVRSGEPHELRLDLPDRRITVTGSIALVPEPHFDLSLALHDVDLVGLVGDSKLAAETSARVDAEASLRGSWLRPADIDVALRVARLDAAAYRMPVHVDRPARIRVAGRHIVDADVSAQVGQLGVRVTRTASDQPVQVVAEGVVPPVWSNEPATVALDGAIDEQRIALRRLSVVWQGATAETAAEIPRSFVDAWLPDAFRSTASNGQHIASAQLQVRAVPVRRIAALAMPDSATSVDGTLDITLSATAARPTLDALQLDGAIERGRLTLEGLDLEQQGRTALAMKAGVVSLTDSRWTGRGTDITVRGQSTILAPPPDYRIDVPAYHVDVVGDVDLSSAVARAADRLAGVARVQLSAGRGPDGMAWNGTVQVRDGAWVPQEQGIAITDVTATLACAEQRCRVDAFNGRINGGTLALTGDLPLPGSTMTARLEAKLSGAGLELPRGTRHDLDADLVLTGGDRPLVTGTVTVWPGTIAESLSGLAALASALRRDAVSSSSAPQASALSGIALDVRIATGDELMFDSPDLQISATADLRIRGTLAEPQLHGELAALDQGRMFLASRDWRIEQATVSLSEGARGTDVRLSAAMSSRISRYAVRIRITGPANRPAVMMSSDPPLGQSELAELVLTGTTTGSGGRSSGGQSVATVLSSDLLTNVGKVFGLDAVRIEQNQSELSTIDVEPVSRLTVSKRLTERFEIVYSQGLSEDGDLAWVIVWRPGWYAVEVRTTFRSKGSEAVELRQEFEFGSPRTRAQAGAVRPSPRRIARVEVTGLTPEQTAAVRARLSLKAGDAFSNTLWQRDRQTISEFFRERDRLRARVRASHGAADDGAYVLTYRIVPGPITRLDVQGYQLAGATRTQLANAWSRAASDALVADALRNVMRLTLAADGFFLAEVNAQVMPVSSDEQVATIAIARGDRIARRTIAFSGNTSIVSADLQRALAARAIEPRCWIDPSVAEEPVASLYQARGFLAVRVTARRVIAGTEATLQVDVDEGPAYTIGAVSIGGVASLGEQAARAGFGLAAGAQFSDAALSGATSNLAIAYVRAGYLDTVIDPHVTVDRDRHAVDIAVTVAEGPVSMLRSVRVVGGEGTSAGLVSGLLAVTPGAAVDRVVLDQAQQRLYETGIFRTVDIDLRPTSTAGGATGDVEAVVTLEERAKYRLRYGVQFGPTTIDNVTSSTNNAEPGATFDLQRRNLYGVGITASAGAVWFGQQYRIRGTVSAPTFFGRFVSTTFTVEQARLDRDTDQYGGIFILDRSLRAILEQRWRTGRVRRIEFAYGFDIDRRRLELTSTSETLPLYARFAALNTTFTYDTRDNLFNPRRGMFHSSRFDTAAKLWLSDIAFAKYQFQQFFYVPAGRVTLASGVRFGTLDVDNERQPSALMLFFKTGGGTSVRGYETDGLTPGYVIGVPAGGKVLLVLNQEVRVPVSRRFGVVGFVDAGNTFTGIDALALGALEVGAGTGLRVETAVAVLRVDVAFPLPRTPGQPRARWYFSIGHAF